MKHKAYFAAKACLALALTATVTKAQEPQPGGTLIVVGGGEPAGLNAAVSTNPTDGLLGCMVYEGLVVMDSTTNQPKSGLAESWEIPDDGRTYTFRLREALWHDGQPFTSEDVRYTLTEVSSKLSPTFAAQVGSNLGGVDTPDPRTAVVRPRLRG